MKTKNTDPNITALEREALAALAEHQAITTENRDLVERMTPALQGERKSILNNTKVDDETAAKLIGDVEAKLLRIPNRVARNQAKLDELGEKLRKLGKQMVTQLDREFDGFYQEVLEGYRVLLKPLSVVTDAGHVRPVDAAIARVFPGSRWDLVVRDISPLIDRANCDPLTLVEGFKRLRAGRDQWARDMKPVLSAVEGLVQ